MFSYFMFFKSKLNTKIKIRNVYKSNSLKSVIMGKRGQVTVFIIIGIILLIIIGLFFYLKENAILKDIFVPKEIIPLSAFAESCIKNAADQAIFLASMQGGYITLPEKIIKDPESYINNGFKVPYWFYKGEDRAPSVNTFIFNIESYINQQALLCINDFSAFQGQYEIGVIKSITTKVKLSSEKMVIETDIDTAIKPKSRDTIIDFPKIAISEPTKIKKLFELSKEIMLKENTEFFLEILTDDMIASSDYLPYAGTEITCNDRTWSVNQITPYIKNMITNNLKFLTFEDTYYQPTGYDYFEKQYRIPLKGNNYEDLQVNTIYNPSWELFLDVTPSTNGIIKPLEFTMSNFLFACFKLYNHKYSVNYPILFQVIDKDNPNEVFFFASPVIVKRNEPNRYNEVPIWPSEVDTETAAQYCNNNETVTQLIVNSKNEITAKTVTKINRENSLTVYAYDELQGMPAGLLDNVSISYQCVAFKCAIGKTAYPSYDGLYTGSSPYLQSKFPECENGILIAEKAGYLQTKQSQTISAETNNFAVNVPLTKLKDFVVRVHVFELSANNEKVERDLLPTESVLITLKNKEKLYQKSLYYPEQNNVELMIAQQSYEVEIKLIENEQIVGKSSAKNLNCGPSKERTWPRHPKQLPRPPPRRPARTSCRRRTWSHPRARR